ncbi:MAG: hypothetical protein LQ344_004999 [Seirophora lacunosa]|nr:MAG: hypothetical protein LQ344_004999 [Seirophora lacunosa]
MVPSTLSSGTAPNAPTETGQSPIHRMKMQVEDGDISDMHGLHRDNDTREEPPSPESSASLVKTVDETEALVADNPSFSKSRDFDTAIGGYITSPMQYDSHKSSSNSLAMEVPNGTGNSLQPVTPPPARPQRQRSMTEPAPASAGTKILAGRGMLISHRNSMFGGGNTTVRLSLATRGSHVFAPSPLNHAHPAPSFVVDDFVKRGPPFSPKSHDSAHPSLSGYSQAALSYSRPTHEYGHSPSPSSQNGSEPPIKKLTNTTKSANNSAPGLRNLRKVVAGTSPSSSKSSTRPLLNSYKDIIVESNGIPTPLRSVRQLAAVSSPSSRAGAPVTLYDQTIPQGTNSIQNHRTPSPPSSFSPISATLASPLRVRKSAKPTKAAVDEDPFEGFNSGSEKDDEADVDFGAATSPSLSVEEMLSPSPTPPDDDEGCRIVALRKKKQKEGSGRGRTTSKGSGAASSSSTAKGATPNRHQVRAERSGAQAIVVSKQNARRRRRDEKGGDWPVAAVAKMSSAARVIESVDQSMGGLEDDDEEEENAGVVQMSAKRKQAGDTKEDALDVDAAVESPRQKKNQRTTGLVEGSSDVLLRNGEVGTSPAEGKKTTRKTTQQIVKSSGRHGSGWALVVEMVEGKKKAVWKLEH